jgi:hypothetical protein
MSRIKLPRFSMGIQICRQGGHVIGKKMTQGLLGPVHATYLRAGCAERRIRGIEETEEGCARRMECRTVSDGREKNRFGREGEQFSWGKIFRR